MGNILTRAFGNSNERDLKRLQPILERINSLNQSFEQFSDEALRDKTTELSGRLQRGESLERLLAEAFAAVREAARRTIGQCHTSSQLMGGIVLHQGKITEIKRGEGKELAAILPLYLNALTSQGCHMVTVSDYLARRDSYWFGPVYHALGVSVACIYSMQIPDEYTPACLFDPSYDSGEENDRWRHFRPISRREAYEADITYGTSSEFGFDYLRDNMATDLSQCVQRPQDYAIVDDADSVLIDESRTPLILSVPGEEVSQLYQNFAHLVKDLQPGQDYEVKAEGQNVAVTDAGYDSVERMLKRKGLLKTGGLHDPENYTIMGYLENALNAQTFYRRDRDYVVKDGEVIIVDDFTGRLMYGRRHSAGLHQAIEAKENVRVQRETRTVATITIRNYCRKYQKLAGTTTMGLVEADSFKKTYGLDVVLIPTNRPIIRLDQADLIYQSEEAKYRVVVRDIESFHKNGRPVLVDTASIEKSEYLSEMLKQKRIPHQVLNAKYHEMEPHIIAQAGQTGAVTVAVGMAGRYVDIISGGSPNGREEAEWQEKHRKVIELGGLHVIGTERHAARRMDYKLRSYAGQQGDPGSSQFYVSLEDDLVRRFGSERLKSLVNDANVDEDSPIENALVSKAIEDAQMKAEAFYSEIRGRMLGYDDLIDKHCEAIYGMRKRVLSGAELNDLKDDILSMVREEIKAVFNYFGLHYYGESEAINFDLEGLLAQITTIFPLPTHLNAAELSKLKPKQLEDRLVEEAEAAYENMEKEFGVENMRMLERLVMLQIIDRIWVEHLTSIENSRHQIANQGMLPGDVLPDLLAAIQQETAHTIFHVSIAKKEEGTPAPDVVKKQTNDGKPQPMTGGKKIGRNDPCPCGSGKKYRFCCGR